MRQSPSVLSGDGSSPHDSFTGIMNISGGACLFLLLSQALGEND